MEPVFYEANLTSAKLEAETVRRKLNVTIELGLTVLCW